MRLSLSILEGAALADGLSCRAINRLQGYSRIIARMTREVRVTEIFNLRMTALGRLRADKAWRDQVRLQLGGYWVIKRWERRLKVQAMRARNTALIQRLAAQAARRAQKTAAQARKASSPRKKVKTAASGLLRLAPVPRLKLTPLRQILRVMPSAAVQPICVSPYALSPDEIRIPELSPMDAWEYSPKLGRYVVCSGQGITPQSGSP